MWNDPIVEEVRRAREEYAVRHGHDLDAIFRDLKEAEEQARRDGWKVMSRVPPAGERSTDSAA